MTCTECLKKSEKFKNNNFSKKKETTNMTKNDKANIQFIWAIAISGIGVLLFFVSFIVPPKGVIDTSVLAAVGELLTFSGALVGIDYSYKKKLLDQPDDKKRD